jgi:hypothetical protein
MSLQLTETFRIVIEVVKEDKNWRCYHAIDMTWLDKTFVCLF